MKKIIVGTLTIYLAVVFCGTVMAQGLNRNSLLNRNNRRNNLPTARQNSPRPTPAPAAASAEADDGAEKGEAPSFNWDQVPVDLVLQAYGDRLGKTILKDPQVPQATITLKSKAGQKFTNEEYLEAIETILEMNQIHLEPYGESFIRALPRKDARKEGIPLYMDMESLELDIKAGKVLDGKTISLMIQFNNIATEEAQKALEGFKSNSGILLVFERTNSILVTDTKQNIDVMMEIAKKIDVASPVTEVVEYIQIKYANANDIKSVIDSIVQESMKEQEKNGKTPQNQPQNNQPRTLLGGLRRPGQQNQPQQPVNNASLVLSVSDADRGMIRGKVVTIADERSNKILLITSASNMKFFKEVIAALDVETTPDTVVKVYRLKYAEAEDVSDMINDLIGNSVSSKGSGKNNQNQNAKKGTSGSVTRGQAQVKKSVNQRSGDTQAGELSKDNTTVLADKRINGIVVMTNKDLVPTVEQIIESMDIKLSQVLIETVIIEVSLGDGIETGMDWVQHGRQTVQADWKNPMGQTMKYRQRSFTTVNSEGETVSSGTQVYTDVVPEGYTASGTSSDGLTTWTDTASEFAAQTAQISTDGLLNYYSGGTATAIAGGQGGEAAYNIANGVTSNIFGKALNFVFTSDELGISAILQATKTDSRSKYIASPVIMTLDNKEAVVNATAMHYLLKGFTSSGNSYSTIAVPDYEQKELGIEIKVTPKINPNGTVMLTVEEKYTQLGSEEPVQYSSSNGQTGSGGLQTVMVPTTITREMQSDVLLENNQTVVFGGLTETYTSESETGIPILKDIPYIGKWLFGTVSMTETRTELLVFMTPYVLDDAQAAQAEALRRKKTLSDPNAWDDHGWSLSNLADPVSQKEQMRRIKDEWKKQDEERQTKMEIEKLKVERAKQLKEMSVEERAKWLLMHKEELEKEEQEELEKKMLDKDSQEELKKLADEVRAKKLKEANAEIKQAEKTMAGENERNRLEREKKEAEEAEKKAEAESEKGKVKGEKVEKTEVKKAEAEKKPEPKAEPAQKTEAKEPSTGFSKLAAEISKDKAKASK